MKKIVGAFLLLPACQWVPGSDAHRIEQGERLAAQTLRDPSSGTFRKVTAHRFAAAGSTTVAVCGEVNGRNVYGAYSGYRKFVAVLPDAVVLGPEAESPVESQQHFNNRAADCARRLKRADAIERIFVIEECKALRDEAADRVKASWFLVQYAACKADQRVKLALPPEIDDRLGG